MGNLSITISFTTRMVIVISSPASSETALIVAVPSVSPAVTLLSSKVIMLSPDVIEYTTSS